MTPLSSQRSTDDYLSRMFFRYFRQGVAAELATPEVDQAEDADFLRLHWAFSRQVVEFATYVADHPHEVQSSQQYSERIDDAIIRGRLNATRTVLLRAVTGHSSLIASEEPLRSFNEGPNHLLLWVLRHAHLMLDRARHRVPEESTYGARIGTALAELSKANRINVIGLGANRTTIRGRPSAKSLVQARRSRRPLYRLAHDAYVVLQDVEAGSRIAIANLLMDTLVGPLKNWQKFELLLAFSMAIALGRVCGKEPVLLPNAAGSGEPIVRVAGYDLYWQTTSALYNRPQPEPSQAKVNAILVEYGIGVGSDRPDVVVIDRTLGAVVSIGEAKYTTDESSTRTDVFRAAIEQLVRYSRGYDRPDEVLASSLAAVVVLPEAFAAMTPSPAVPLAASLDDLLSERIERWAHRVVEISQVFATA